MLDGTLIRRLTMASFSRMLEPNINQVTTFSYQKHIKMIHPTWFNLNIQNNTYYSSCDVVIYNVNTMCNISFFNFQTFAHTDTFQNILITTPQLGPVQDSLQQLREKMFSQPRRSSDPRPFKAIPL